MQPAVDHLTASGIHPVPVVILFGNQRASFELPLCQILRGKQPPLLIGMIFFQTVPLKKHPVFAAVPAQAIGIIQKARRRFQMVILFFI